ncbi:MAG: alcohol dehydrogenase, partial [Mesorhizobium sp.]
MKAMVLESIGTPLKLIDRPDPIPGVGEIRLKVEACA